jgi:hypothetical protein
VIYSQEYDITNFFTFNLNTELSDIILFEGNPDFIDQKYNVYTYKNRNINGFIGDLEYIFINNKIIHIKWIFNKKRNNTIDFMSIFRKFIEYNDIIYGPSILINEQTFDFYSFFIIWETNVADVRFSLTIPIGISDVEIILEILFF